ncbi:MAG: hypothetical protein JWQ88_1622 [Rhodoferax sp.]|nr:hypothetical protein [Rhodoferax sp.]
MSGARVPASAVQAPPGGRALPHRAMRNIAMPMGRLFGSLALALALTCAVLALRPWIALAWETELLWWIHSLGLPGQFGPASTAMPGLMGLPVPTLGLALPAYDAGAAFSQALAVGVVWWCMAWLPDEAKPVAFFVRLAALIHGFAVLFFILWPASFSHSVQTHVGSGMRQAWYLMLLTPAIHLATYYLFPFAMWQRALLSLVTLLFLFVFTPLQYALHLALVERLGLIVMPVLHLLFGVMMVIIGFVALYGWAMGWRSREVVQDAFR